MEDSSAYSLFGTEIPNANQRLLRAGAVTAALEDGNLKNIRCDDIEILRAIGFIVRDRDWGTLSAQISDLKISESIDYFSVTYHAVFENNGAQLDVYVSIQARENKLVFSASATPTGQFETNRTGFTILHPINVSGHPVEVEHSDGSIVEECFPDLIDPWQPIKNIQCLAHEVSGIAVACRMKGDVFEMEDQRNWSDASFKTYTRPLALPWPYTLDPGTSLSHSVSVSVSGASNTPAETEFQISISRGRATGCVFPETAFVITPAEALEAVKNITLLHDISPQRITCHYDPSAEHTPEDLKQFGQLQKLFPAIYDLEYAVEGSGNLHDEFRRLASGLREAGLNVSSILVCPSVDRQSTPPGSEWPDCPPLEDVYSTAKEFFGNVKIGGGMLSYFTELNRKRPPLKYLDYISHGTNPIVHAADDQSVMQTLETIPYILKSTMSFAGSIEYRLGLSSIPMRQNPYGAKTMDNPQNTRICMANSDPRHWAQFGAAFTFGYAAAIAPFGIESWTPSAFTGSRGIVTKEGKVSPLGRAVSELTKHAGCAVSNCNISHPSLVAAILIENTYLIANLTNQPVSIQMDDRETITLSPYENILV